MISITQILVRDADMKTDTAITLAPGGALYLSQLPKNWTLDFAFSGKFRQAAFVLDGKPIHIEEAAPYCPAGDNTPINLQIGLHSILVTIDAQPPMVIPFSVAQNPIAMPTSEVACAFGSNGGGITDLYDDPALHPALLTTCKSLNFQYLRLWTDGDFKTPFAADYWAIPLKWAAGGIKILAVMNFQNSPNCAAPSDADWLMKINSLPASRDAGVWGICIGNECDTSAYFTGTTAQLAHLLQLAYPILKSKGYVVIAPSFILSLQNVRTFVAAMGTNLAFDYLDYHVYPAGADQGLSQIDAFLAYCKTIDKPGMISESGIRGQSTNPIGWAAQITALYTGLKSRTGIFLQFPLYWFPTAKDDMPQMAPLGRDLATPNEPFASAWKTIAA